MFHILHFYLPTNSAWPFYTQQLRCFFSLAYYIVMTGMFFLECLTFTKKIRLFYFSHKQNKVLMWGSATQQAVKPCPCWRGRRRETGDSRHDLSLACTNSGRPQCVRALVSRPTVSTLLKLKLFLKSLQIVWEISILALAFPIWHVSTRQGTFYNWQKCHNTAHRLRTYVHTRAHISDSFLQNAGLLYVHAGQSGPGRYHQLPLSYWNLDSGITNLSGVIKFKSRQCLKNKWQAKCLIFKVINYFKILSYVQSVTHQRQTKMSMCKHAKRVWKLLGNLICTRCTQVTLKSRAEY